MAADPFLNGCSAIRATTRPPVVSRKLWSLVRGSARGRNLSSSRVVPSFTGLVLIVAALLKTEKLWTDPMSADTPPGPWGLALLIELEFGLGLGLMSGLCSGLLRKVGLVLFGAFTGVALSRLVGGERSCSCAGRIEILPGLLVIADLVVVAALLVWRPLPSPKSFWLNAGLTVTLVVVAPWPLLAASRPIPYPRLIVAPRIDLGKMCAGERRSFAIEIRNPHNEPVKVVALPASCPCVAGEALPWHVEPRQTATVALALDLGQQTRFSGRLSLELKGRTHSHDVAFSTAVAVAVD
jgi:hypothetical protein